MDIINSIALLLHLGAKADYPRRKRAHLYSYSHNQIARVLLLLIVSLIQNNNMNHQFLTLRATAL